MLAGLVAAAAAAPADASRAPLGALPGDELATLAAARDAAIPALPGLDAECAGDEVRSRGEPEWGDSQPLADVDGRHDPPGPARRSTDGHRALSVFLPTQDAPPGASLLFDDAARAPPG